MVQFNEFYRLLKKCNECQKRRLMSIIWKMKCSHIVGPSPNRNHYHHSEVKKRQELSVDPEYRMSDDAAKIYHFTTCRKLSTQRGEVTYSNARWRHSRSQTGGMVWGNLWWEWSKGERRYEGGSGSFFTKDRLTRTSSVSRASSILADIARSPP